MKLRSLFLLISLMTASVCFAQYDAKVNVEVTAVDLARCLTATVNARST